MGWCAEFWLYIQWGRNAAVQFYLSHSFISLVTVIVHFYLIAFWQGEWLFYTDHYRSCLCSACLNLHTDLWEIIVYVGESHWLVLLCLYEKRLKIKQANVFDFCWTHFWLILQMVTLWWFLYYILQYGQNLAPAWSNNIKFLLFFYLHFYMAVYC